jgi:hypothetical protein
LFVYNDATASLISVSPIVERNSKTLVDWKFVDLAYSSTTQNVFVGLSAPAVQGFNHRYTSNSPSEHPQDTDRPIIYKYKIDATGSAFDQTANSCLYDHEKDDTNSPVAVVHGTSVSYSGANLYTLG